MEFLVEPTIEETDRSCAQLAAASLPPSRANLILYSLYAAVGVLAAIFTPVTMARTVAIAVGALAIATLLLQLDGRRRLQRARTADPHSLEPYHIEVGPNGLRAWCEHVDTRYTWSGISCVKDTSDFLLFVRGPGGGLAIPKRVISPEQMASFKAQIPGWAPGIPFP